MSFMILIQLFISEADLTDRFLIEIFLCREEKSSES
jgi:hypothetical protein